MVSDAECIETVLPRFMDFIKDTVLVAHNATFDTAFIKKNCDDLNLEFDNTVMDTVPLARFLYPELKRVKLNLVAKHLGVSLDNHHRAVDDAKATAEIFIISVNKITFLINIASSIVQAKFIGMISLPFKITTLGFTFNGSYFAGIRCILTTPG